MYWLDVNLAILVEVKSRVLCEAIDRLDRLLSEMLPALANKSCIGILAGVGGLFILQPAFISLAREAPSFRQGKDSTSAVARTSSHDKIFALTTSEAFAPIRATFFHGNCA